ncbi:rhomboid family intramembrane serine protease [Bacteroidia bacterium]|nr:rhomboid family intramembrane serine protease [Bacteroidia bacterium]
MQFRSNQFNVPEVTKNIIIINVVMFIGTYFLGYTELFLEQLSLYHFTSENFKPWQLVTHMFMHGYDIYGSQIEPDYTHIIFNMFGVWMFGSRLEQVWGAKKYLTFYFITGLGAAALHMALLSYYAYQGVDISNSSVLGASGALFGILVAFAYYWPNTELYIMFIPVPIKAKYLVGGYAAYELIAGVGGFQTGVAHFAHLGGALFGFLLVKYWNKTNRKTLY